MFNSSLIWNKEENLKQFMGFVYVIKDEQVLHLNVVYQLYK